MPGQVSAWGDDANGELGDGANVDHASAVSTRGLADVVQVSSGEAFSMAVTATGSVYAWGDNEFGDFGIPTPHPSEPLPVQVTGLSGVKQVATGFEDGLALLSNGTVMGWGFNAHGAVGDGTTTPRPTPVHISGLSGVVAVAQGEQHSLALLSNGTVMSWGQTPGADQLQPAAVPGLSGVVAIAAGGFHDLALLSNGTIMAWGEGGNGQLGNGSFNNQTTPVPVSGVSTAVGIAAGTFFSLALLRDGTVVGFGSNQYNQLGSGATSNQDLPVPVSGVSGATQITAGDQFSAALLSNGTALAWGSNAHGALGNGTVGTTFSVVATPTPVVGLSGATAISAGGAHTLALSGPVAPPAPVLGQAVNVAPVSGLVLIKPPRGKSLDDAFDPALVKGQGFVPLTAARQLPVGSQVDARAGTLQVTAATSKRHVTQIATLSGAVFSLSQARTGREKGLTVFALLEGDFPGGPSYRSCRAHAAPDESGPGAWAAKVSPKVLQTLHASDHHGRWGTRGHDSSATVRGTVWDTVDRCDGTLTVVKRGTVRVFDFRRKITITVHAGKRYLAKAR